MGIVIVEVEGLVIKCARRGRLSLVGDLTQDHAISLTAIWENGRMMALHI